MKLIIILIAATMAVAQAPHTEIANKEIRAKLLLPDAKSGYYRGTRFDWSGQIESLEWKGHNYFGKWFGKYDPKTHDAIMGPVEEFVTGIGYADAKVGDTFVRIGVGTVRKPEEASYQQFKTYDIVDPGMWVVSARPDHISYTHRLRNAYVYTKTLRLLNNTLVMEHQLKNTSKKPLITSVYQHNFYMLDGAPTGPDVSVKFPFGVSAVAELKDRAETRDHEFHYTQDLPTGQSVYSELTGFGPRKDDYDIRVENRATHAGVRQTSDHPMSKLVLWSIRTTVCPEAYIDLNIAPGATATWRITYEFYEVKP